MKRWKISPPNPEATRISTALKLSLPVAQILANRGLAKCELAEKFLRPRLADLRDPLEIPNIEKAARRVLLAKARREKVVIYGDYDVDGVTGTAILVSTLRFLDLEVTYYIPHRYGEGYSLSLESVRSISQTGTKLIITVDCGIASLIEVEEANALGIDVIVTDHHNLPNQLPKALAIVNPKQLPGEHPSRYLSGAGVAFKFAWALLKAAGAKDASCLNALLDLAGLGTISDVVPLTDENRILAVSGLKVINEQKRLGIRALCEAASLSGTISVNNIYFGLAPRLNAAGRLEHASKSVELLLAEDQKTARELARELNRVNSRRQDIGTAIKEDVFALINNQVAATSKIIVLSGQDWHPGVIGIVASNVVDAFYRPTILIGVTDGIGRGSARSIEGINIFDLLSKCHDLFLDFGGHEGAAGFEIKAEDIPVLKQRLIEIAEQAIRPEDLEPEITIDYEVEPADLTLNLVKELALLEPFGEGNQAPIFMLKDLTLSDVKKVGADGKHLKAWFEQGGVRLEAIGFGLGNSFNSPQLIVGNCYNIVFELESNEWNGFEKVQLSLIDIQEGK